MTEQTHHEKIEAYRNRIAAAQTLPSLTDRLKTLKQLKAVFEQCVQENAMKIAKENRLIPGTDRISRSTAHTINKLNNQNFDYKDLLSKVSEAKTQQFNALENMVLKRLSP